MTQKDPGQTRKFPALTPLVSGRARSRFQAWQIVLLVMIGGTIALDVAAINRTRYVSNLAAEDRASDPASPTGYLAGKRWLIVPEHDNATFQWIRDTQRMVADGAWRFHFTPDENAPFGREVHVASAFRWWLVFVGWCEHLVTGNSLTRSIEDAALFANPALHFFFLIGATILAARVFGGTPAMLVCLGIGTIYPFAFSFMPGIATDQALSEILILGSILFLLGGVFTKGSPSRWFVFAGIIGGMGLWVSAATETSVLAGIGLGAISGAILVCPRGPGAKAGSAALPWKIWALSGAVTSFAAYLIEYYPHQMDLRFQVNQPLYGLAWLALGEVLEQLDRWFIERKPLRFLNIVLGLLALAMLIAFPIILMHFGVSGAKVTDLAAFRLSNQPDGVVAENLAAWYSRDGLTLQWAATVSALSLVCVGIWFIRRVPDLVTRRALALALGPVAIAFVVALGRIRDWNVVDAEILMLILALAVTLQRAPQFAIGRAALAAAAGLVFVLGSLERVAATAGVKPDQLTRAEVEGLYERAVAHFVADHSTVPAGIVLTPPYRTASFSFYGGLRGVGSPNWENHDGLGATVRIVSALRPDEAQALVTERGINNIILPSWDLDLTEFARLGSGHLEDSFIYKLQHGIVFDWLRVLPYKLPAVGGLDGQSITIMEVTPEVDRSVTISRFAEYFVEMQQLDFANTASEVLRHYPGDLGSLVAIATVEKAKGDTEAFNKVFKALLSNLATGSDRNLLWDRRVSLAVVLALGGRRDLAQNQLQRCIDEIDAEKLRFLTTGSLYHLQVLCNTFGLSIADPKLSALSRTLLPEELRKRL